MGRLYLRSKKLDMMSTIQRCYFDADNGRVQLALERLQDLESEIGEDVHTAYAEGILYRDFLGQGVRAYACFAKAMSLDPNHASSAFNAAMYAPDEISFRRWMEISNRLAPQDSGAFSAALEVLGKGYCYHDLIMIRIEGYASQESEPSTEADLIELALLGTGPGSDEESTLRKRRAQLLRVLDMAEAQHRETMAEDYPPEERLALTEGMAELDRVLALDEWDAQMWNFKSAWSILLGNFPQAVACADRAIELRPDGYCRPHQNRAMALWQLGRRDEALASLEEALHQAEVGRQPEEIEHLRPLLDASRKNHQKSVLVSDLSELQPFLKRIVTAAELTAQKELEELTQSERNSMGFSGTVFEFAATAFQQRIGQFRRQPNDALPYVPAMAQALSYMGPEACLGMLSVLRVRGNEHAYENCLSATLYIAAHAERVMQRDALRLLILAILRPALTTGQERAIRDAYRKWILEVSAAATDELAQLDPLMRAAMAKIQQDLPRLLADQSPVNGRGIESAKSKILGKLQGEPFVNRAENFRMPDLAPSTEGVPQPGPTPEADAASRKAVQAGCGASLVILLGFLALKYFHVIPWNWTTVVPVAIVASLLIGRLFAQIVSKRG